MSNTKKILWGVGVLTVLALSFGAWFYVRNAPNPEPLVPDALPARPLELPSSAAPTNDPDQNNALGLGASIDAIDLGPDVNSMFTDVDADINKL